MNQALTSGWIASRQRGVTLIELMVTISVAAILMAIAVPSFESIIRRNRAAAVTNQFIHSLHLARSEAVKRGRNVIVCPSTSVNESVPDCDEGAAWTDGWIIYSDENGDNTYNAGDVLIRVGQISNQALTITPGPFATGIQFRPTGDPKKPDGSNFSNGTFRLCIPKVNPRRIVISTVGRIRLEILKDETCPE